MVTIEEIYTSVLPPDTLLLAGAARINRQASWVLVLKPRPPGLEAPRGEELILLSTHTLTALDPQLTLARALGPLAAKASAVAVRGDVPVDAVQEAERLGLPLFQLPASISLTALERDILQFLSERRSEWYRRKHSVLNELAALAVQGKGLSAIAKHVGDVTGHAVLFEDERGEVLAWYLPPHFPQRYGDAVRAFVEGQEPSLQSLPESASPSENPLLSHDELGRLSAPVRVKDTQVGTVSLLGPARALDPDAHLVLEAGATAGAIELAREHAVLETVHRIQGDLISDLITGASDVQTLDRRARKMGYDLDATRVAVAISPVEHAGNGQASLRDVLNSLSKRLTRVLTTNGVQAPFHLDDDLLTVFYPLEQEMTPAALKRLAERLCRDLADAARHHRLYAGISRQHSGVASFRTGFEEARRALELGRAIAPDRTITYFGDLGIYRVLFAMRGAHELLEFYEDMLGRLVRYDREKKTELIHTLDAYLCSGNATESADRLNLHRNSLLYRLRRIQEITGLDLDDPETRLSLHLALRVGETLRTETLLGA